MLPTPIQYLVGNAVLDVLEEEKLVENATKVGDFLHQEMETIRSKHPTQVGRCGGSGLLFGVELLNDEGKPCPRLAEAVKYKWVEIERPLNLRLGYCSAYFSSQEKNENRTIPGIFCLVYKVFSLTEKYENSNPNDWLIQKWQPWVLYELQVFILRAISFEFFMHLNFKLNLKITPKIQISLTVLYFNILCFFKLWS